MTECECRCGFGVMYLCVCACVRACLSVVRVRMERMYLSARMCVCYAPVT